MDKTNGIEYKKISNSIMEISNLENYSSDRNEKLSFSDS